MAQVRQALAQNFLLIPLRDTPLHGHAQPFPGRDNPFPEHGNRFHDHAISPHGRAIFLLGAAISIFGRVVIPLGNTISVIGPANRFPGTVRFVRRPAELLDYQSVVSKIAAPSSGESMTVALHLSRHSATTPDPLPPAAPLPLLRSMFEKEFTAKPQRPRRNAKPGR